MRLRLVALRLSSIAASAAVLCFGSAAVSPGRAQGTTPPPATPVADTSASQSYLLPGDVIRVRILREPDLSGDFSVDEKGYATLPRMGPLYVSKYRPDSLKTYLITTMGQTLRDPTIEVTFLRRVTVLGAVTKPGLYNADPTMTISEVLALAGGATPDGRKDRVDLFRGGVKYRADVSTTSALNSTSMRSGDQIYVEERGWIARNPYVFTGLIGAAVGIIAIIASKN
jgi:polysaccharide export outer membrane protein